MILFLVFLSGRNLRSDDCLLIEYPVDEILLAQSFYSFDIQFFSNFAQFRHKLFIKLKNVVHVLN